MSVIFTVGHSTHSKGKFLELLQAHGVSAVADVRSSPYSQHNPQFNRESLALELKVHRIAYVFLGRELGARSTDPDCYVDGKVQYGRLSKTSVFRAGLERVCRGATSHRIALMCAEKDPLTCHRCILVARRLVEQEIEVQHILANGQLESHTAALRRLIAELRLQQSELFEARSDPMADAYRLREEQIAYVDKELAGLPFVAPALR